MNNPLIFDEIKTGQHLPSFTTTISRTDIVKYAGASGDFNPLHHDDEQAKSLGLPSVFAMGLLHGGYLSKVLTDWAGPAAVQRYKIRFLGPVWPGDKITCGGTVRAKQTEGDRDTVHCDLFVETKNGIRVIEGEADLVFPSINLTREK